MISQGKLFVIYFNTISFILNISTNYYASNYTYKIAKWFIDRFPSKLRQESTSGPVASWSEAKRTFFHRRR